MTRGAILLNGNAEKSADLLAGARALLLGSRHIDAGVAASRRLLLVTAAWEDEHAERHVKEELNAMGLESRFEDGFDRTIMNLSIGQELRGVLDANRDLAQAQGELAAMRDSARSFYLSHNAHLVAMARRVLAEARGLDASLTLAILADRERMPAGGDPRSLYRYTLARELRHVLDTLEGNDDRMVELSTQIDETALDAAGIAYAKGWAEARQRLETRILESNAIIFFGGHLDRLLDALRFFRLRGALVEALRRGTSVIGTSAGAMVLGERVIVYDDFAHERREFQLWERGLGLLRRVQLFPHCMERIQTDDGDNLAYLARRFRHRVCVGLNARSFLLVDHAARTATSIGEEDGVYVFGPSGEKRRYDAGDAIELQ